MGPRKGGLYCVSAWGEQCCLTRDEREMFYVSGETVLDCNRAACTKEEGLKHTVQERSIFYRTTQG